MIEGQAFFWQQTNDIHSPTHNSDLESSVLTLVDDGILSEEEGQILLEGLDGIFYAVIRNLK
jgi:hypothetical protein